MRQWWAEKAWPWLKKNWWLVLLFPLGLLVVINKVFRPHLTVTSSELTGAAEEEQAADAEARRRALEAEVEKSHRVQEIYQEHSDAVKALTQEQKARVQELEEDPDALNAFLLETGKNVRRS